MTSPYYSGAIFTDARGVPVDRPEPVALDAPIDERIAHMRAVNAYNDRVAGMANLSFAEAFRREIKR